MIRLLLLVFLPIAAALYYLVPVSPIWVFVTGAIAVAVLADWIRQATDQLASHVGSAIGGLLTVSFGSIAELLLGFFVLRESGADVVRAQLTGSILGTSLLGLGLAMVAGGLKRDRQTFKRERAGLLASMLILVVIALLLPAVFDVVTAGHRSDQHALWLSDERLSFAVSCVLLLLYVGNLVFTLITHRDVFAHGNEGSEKEGGAEASWSLTRAFAVLIAATLAAAFGAEIVSNALEATAKDLGLPILFLGLIPLALIGTSSDLIAAVAFARQDRMGLVMSICIGSAIQAALVIAPVLVIASAVIGPPMTLVFSDRLQLFAIAGTAFIVNAIAGDGETTWFEGMLLVGVYVLLAFAFFFTGGAA